MSRLPVLLTLGTTMTATWLAAGAAYAADVEPAVRRGLTFLARSGPTAPPGEAALAALAMIKANVPPTDPGLAGCLRQMNSQFTSGGVYSPRMSGGHDIYEAAVTLLALANLDPVAYKPQIETVAQFLIGRQKANGSWDYVQRESGDSSISQYAILGLWEAENVGVAVPPRLWDDAASWYLSVQGAQGSWNYHRDESTTYRETLSMTAAGVGSLLICQRQLANYRRGGGELNPLLTPLAAASKFERYDVRTPVARINQAVQAGLTWIGRNFNLAPGGIVGQSANYCLYGIERVGALAVRDNLGGINWFEQGSRYLLSTQQSAGHWGGTYGDVPNTAWAILFMERATKRSIDKVVVNRLPAATLRGGRGLPSDPSSLTITAGGRMLVRPMNGAIEGMLEVLEDPRTENVNSALLGLEQRYRAGGPAVLQPHRDRLIALLKNPEPEVRRGALRLLAYLGEFAMVPRLIEVLRDPAEDPAVVEEAQAGLRLISRKIEGFGSSSPATPAEREQAANAWQAWYRAARPLEADGPEGDR